MAHGPESNKQWAQELLSMKLGYVALYQAKTLKEPKHYKEQLKKLEVKVDRRPTAEDIEPYNVDITEETVKNLRYKVDLAAVKDKIDRLMKHREIMQEIEQTKLK